MKIALLAIVTDICINIIYSAGERKTEEVRKEEE